MLIALSDAPPPAHPVALASVEHVFDVQASVGLATLYVCSHNALHLSFCSGDQKFVRCGTCCAGYSHALEVDGFTLCPGGGTRRKAAHGQGHEPLLDDSAWTGTELTGKSCHRWFNPWSICFS